MGDRDDDVSDPVDRARGSLLGLAIGDALGTTVEFAPRGSFEPVTDVVGGGPFGLAAGEWTDDTSMALCLADSLLECGGFDAGDQARRYLRWMREGYRSVNGRCFDVGNTVASALRSFERTGDPFSGPLHARSAGNGSIMRLVPVVLFAMPDASAAVELAGESSRTTHGAPEAVAACRLLAVVLSVLLAGGERAEAFEEMRRENAPTDAIAAVRDGAWLEKSREEIRGSGYVVESLEAALWCLARSQSFEEAVLTAVNLGDDADTTGAVCGQLAGALWGASAIPAPWRRVVAWGDEIAGIADRLLRA